MINESIESSLATLMLNDPAKRNALGLAMFDALDAALARIAQRDDVKAVLLGGEGPVFCSGFDLTATAARAERLGEFILRLSAALRGLRRLPQPVVAAVQGAAIAGGCALVSACDFAFVSRTAKLGYPVHALGISPAVTLPTLMQAIGAGPARALVMEGALIDGVGAKRRGLATHLSESDAAVATDARHWCAALAAKPPAAVRFTKAWLNELDGSLDDERFDRPAAHSAQQRAGR